MFESFDEQNSAVNERGPHCALKGRTKPQPPCRMHSTCDEFKSSTSIDSALHEIGLASIFALQDQTASELLSPDWSSENGLHQLSK